MKIIINQSQHNFLLGMNDNTIPLSEIIETQKRALKLLSEISTKKIDFVVFFENYKKDLIKEVFYDSLEIKQKYKTYFGKKIIYESSYVLEKNIDDFFNFISSCFTKNPKLNEQATKEMGWLERVKQYGIMRIMEQLRGYLFTNVGMAIQFLVSLTGIGSIATDIVWAIFALYDSYQYFVNGDVKHLTYLIVDVICILSGGLLAKALKPVLGIVGKSISEVLGKLLNSSAGKSIQPILAKVPTMIELVMSKATSIQNFMINNLKMSWAANMIGKLKGWLAGFSEWCSKWLNKGVNTGVKVINSKPFLRRGIEVTGKFSDDLLGRLFNTNAVELTKAAGKSVDKAVIKAANSEIKKQMTEKPTEEILRWVDKNYGSHYGDLYAIYLGATKLAKHQAKLGTATYGVSDYGGELIRGNDPGTKTQREVERIDKGIKNLVASAP